jgi:hypothetical protein
MSQACSCLGRRGSQVGRVHSKTRATQIRESVVDAMRQRQASHATIKQAPRSRGLLPAHQSIQWPVQPTASVPIAEKTSGSDVQLDDACEAASKMGSRRIIHPGVRQFGRALCSTPIVSIHTRLRQDRGNSLSCHGPFVSSEALEVRVAAVG